MSGLRVARDAGTVLLSSPVLPGSRDGDTDQRRRGARKDAKVTAVLHTSSPVRYWDHELGPDQPRLYALAEPDPTGPGGHPDPTELTPDPGRALDEATYTITPDGATAVTSWLVPHEPGMPRATLVAIDTGSGERRVLADEPGADFGEPAVSPDGGRLVCVRTTHSGYDDPPRVSLRLLDLTTGASRELVEDPDIWPSHPVFSADGAAVFFLAAELGHQPVFRVELADGTIRRVAGKASYTDVQVAPDGTALYALRSAVDRPPHRCAWTRQPPTPIRSSCRLRARPPCRARWSRSAPPRPTAPPSTAGSPCRPAGRPTPRRRCCSGSTVDR